MYTPLAQRKTITDTTPIVGYTPVAQRTSTPTPVAQPFNLSSPTPPPSGTSTFSTPQTSVPNSTPSTVPLNSPTVQSFTGGLLRDTGQGIARSIASAGLTIASKVNPQADSFKPSDFTNPYIQSLVETVFGKELQDTGKPIEDRVVDFENKTAQFQDGLKETLKTPGLSSLEKTVLNSIAYANPKTISFPVVMGSIGFDLTPVGGLEENAYKAFIKTATEGDALILLKRMGVNEDLAKNFAQDVVKVSNKTEAKSLFNNIADMQLKTKPANVYNPIGEVATQIPKKEITQVDHLIADGKIRLGRIDNRDVYYYKKGNIWQKARDESSAVKAVTSKEKPANPILDQMKTELEIKKEALDQMEGKKFMKYVSKTTGQLPENTGKETMKSLTGSGKTVKTSQFGKSGDEIVQKILGAGEDYKSAPTVEMAQQKVDEYISMRDSIKQLEKDIKEIPKNKPASLQTTLETPLSKAEAKSLEESAQQSLNTVDEPFRDKVPSLKNIITDTNTPVNEKVGALDYFRTPDKVLTKIGLGDVAKELRTGYDNYVKELPTHLQIITDWSKQVPKESNKRIFKFLDGQKVTLNETEQKVADEIKQYLGEWAYRLGLPEDNQLTHYITHIFDLSVNQKEFDEDIAKIIKDKVPGSVYDPFLEKRLGKKGYIEDTWKALDAYVKRAVRKSNMDSALLTMKNASKRLEESQLAYVTKLGARINMRPTEWDNLLDNTIKQLVGYRFGQRPTALISSTLRKLVYRGSLGLNVSSAIKNLTQGVNTFAKLGARDTLLGYVNLLKPGMSKELEESGVLRAGFIQDRTLSATRQLLQKADKGLFVMFETAEKINRGSAYFGAKALGLRKGMTEEKAIEYAKQIVRDTQFQFGSIDTPVAMQGDIAKTLFQFGSFSQKQTEFLVEMAKKKEYAGLVRYILASTVLVYTIGKTFNIKGQDFNPLNYFSRFGSPPSLALPLAVVKAVTNMPDQYGKTPTTKTKINNIINSGKMLVPAGIQLSKFLKGQVIGGQTPAKTKTTKTKTVKVPKGLPQLPSLKKKLSIPNGLPKLPTL